MHLDINSPSLWKYNEGMGDHSLKSYSCKGWWRRAPSNTLVQISHSCALLVGYCHLYTVYTVYSIYKILLLQTTRNTWYLIVLFLVPMQSFNQLPNPKRNRHHLYHRYHRCLSTTAGRHNFTSSATSQCFDHPHVENNLSIGCG